MQNEDLYHNIIMISYWIYKQRNIPFVSFSWVHLNWYYDLSFFLWYQEYSNPLIKSVIDWKIKWWDHFLLIVDHDMTKEQLDMFTLGIPEEFDVQIMEREDIVKWIKEIAKLKEVDNWKFIVREADEFMWLPTEYITL